MYKNNLTASANKLIVVILVLLWAIAIFYAAFVASRIPEHGNIEIGPLEQNQSQQLL